MRPREVRRGISIEPIIVSPSGLPLDRVDPDALRSLQRLQERGFEAYLVGGCVRDLLLGRQPKDFDIATSARPQQVKRTFPRNCRIIGRRFKLAHLHFHNNTKILEVSTFRCTPQDSAESEDLLITQDNEFGSAEEDALRRDFTVNALFFDPLRDRVLDYAGGLHDVQHLTIRTIGVPIVRFREDPVRILRAAKFAGRLGFTIDGPTLEAMAEVAPDLNRSAPPRVLEEILRLLRGGHALASFQILRDIGALRVVLPLVGEFLAAAPEQERLAFWRVLDAVDAQVSVGRPPSNPVLLAALFHGPVARTLQQSMGPAEAEPAAPPRINPAAIVEELLGPLTVALRLPRRDAGCVKRICLVQARFQTQGRRRFKPASFLRDPYFREALEFFALWVAATGEGHEELAHWQELASHGRAPRALPQAEPATRREGEGAAGSADLPLDAEDRVDEREAEDAELEVAEATTDLAPVLPFGDAEPGGGRRRRRRRRRRGRGRGHDETGAEPLGGAGPFGEPGRAPSRPERTPERAPHPAAVEARAERGPGPDRGPRHERGPRPERHGQNGSGEGRGRRHRDRRRNQRERRPEKVEVIEPEQVDLSAFDVELDPRRAATFGALVEGQQKKRKPPSRGLLEEDEYKPPPPPGSDAPPPPPPAPQPDDTFGDW